jgi:renalase
LSQIDIAIIGAGIAGLTCGQILQQAGYSVVLVEKSRGVGGRLATRRLHGTAADHGTCYLSPKGELFREFVEDLTEEGVVKVWTNSIYGLTADGLLQPPEKRDRTPRYVAPAGMNAIAKFLAPGLKIWFNQRAIGLTLTAAHTWQITLENTHPEADRAAQITTLEASNVIVTVPVPQAIDLLEPLEPSVVATDFLDQLRAVEFDACIAVMAGYTDAQLQDWEARYAEVKAIAPQHPSIGWVGLDSSKRPQPTPPVVVVQSTAAFAKTALDAGDLTPIGAALLQSGAELLVPWLANPEWLQVHRWRYAIPSRPLSQKFLVADTPAPLFCAGDWCGGMRVESALMSGLEVADYINRQSNKPAIARFRFWRSL